MTNIACMQLSIATLATTFVGSWAMMGGKKKEGEQKGPPINAKDQDEEKFIQYVEHRELFRD